LSAEAALWFDDLYVLRAKGREKHFNIFRLEAGWDQFVQLVERKGAIPIAKLDCLSDNFRQFHLALQN